jgi:hypothetical protein
MGPDGDGDAVANADLGEVPLEATSGNFSTSVPVKPLLLGEDKPPGVVTPKVGMQQTGERVDVALRFGRGPLVEDRCEPGVGAWHGFHHARKGSTQHRPSGRYSSDGG